MAGRDGILVGIDPTNETPRMIDEVESGKACGCICPECRTPLIAKKGRLKAHHFAHANLPSSILSCQETALHLAAKIVAAHFVESLRIPEREQRFNSSVRAITESGHLTSETHYVTVKGGLEKRLSGRVEPIVPEISPFRPDARISTPTGDLFIEIKVTHGVDDRKQQALQRADVAVLELDLSNVPRSGISLEDLVNWVSSKAKRGWVSKGLAGRVTQAKLQIDQAIEEREKYANHAMLRELKQFSPRSGLFNVQVSTVRYQSPGEDFELPFSPPGSINLSFPRSEKGFMLADIPGAEGALITNSNNRKLIARLFAWHQTVKGHALTVLSIASPPTLYSNSLDTVRQVIKSILGPNQQLSQEIQTAAVVGHKPKGGQHEYGANNYLGMNLRPQDLPVPLTPPLLATYKDRAFVGAGVPESLARALISTDIFDIVITQAAETARSYLMGESLVRAYVWRAVYEDLETLSSARSSGTLMDELVYRIKYNDPCTVRFVPSIAEHLKGNLFNRLTEEHGKIFLEDAQLGRQQIHIDRADLWKQGGILVHPDYMRRGDFHLEPSNSLLRTIKALHG